MRKLDKLPLGMNYNAFGLGFSVIESTIYYIRCL